MKISWKALAIIFMILFALETAYIIWAVDLYFQEKENTNICFNIICKEYDEAFYEAKVCDCYDYNSVIDTWEIVHTEYFA